MADWGEGGTKRNSRIKLLKKNMTNVFNSRPFLTYYEGFSELNFFQLKMGV